MNRRQRLLVVDGGAATRATLSEYLDGIGYRARFASSGDQALAMLRGDSQFDGIVYDAAMPAMGGSAFVQKLHANGSEMPVLLMTTRGRADGQGAEAANAVIAKPFQLVDFGDKLLRMFAGATVAAG